jgi:phage terminase small subunit
MQRFVGFFDGNATDACRKAGYAGDDATLATQGWRLLRNAEVRAAIEAREEASLAPFIANREERQAFWTRLMADDRVDLDVRLKASELLGKSEADFTDRVKHEGGVSISVVDPYAEKPK